MSIDWNQASTLRGAIWLAAAAAAPVAAQVATQTGHADVVDDINKAGQAASMAETLINNRG